MYVFVPQVVIKTSRCRLWPRRFELMGFRKLPCMLSTVAGVSSIWEAVSIALTKTLILRCFLSLEQFAVGDFMWPAPGKNAHSLTLHLPWPGDFHALSKKGIICLNISPCCPSLFARASSWKEDRYHI